FISLFFLADSLAALGIPDPGRLTTFGLPFFRAIAWILMALSIGSFMTTAFFISPDIPEKDNSRLNEARLTVRSEEHTSELQSRFDLVCRLLRGTKKSTSTS